MINLFDRIRLLQQTSIFSEVETDDLRFLAELLQEEIYFKDDCIFNMKDYGNEMYIIISGKIGISLNNKKDDYISILEAGESFGEMNLLDGQTRSATARVIEDCNLLSLSKSNLRGLILSYPEISLGMLRSLSLRLRNTNKKVIENS